MCVTHPPGLIPHINDRLVLSHSFCCTKGDSAGFRVQFSINSTICCLYQSPSSCPWKSPRRSFGQEQILKEGFILFCSLSIVISWGLR